MTLCNSCRAAACGQAERSHEVRERRAGSLSNGNIYLEFATQAAGSKEAFSTESRYRADQNSDCGELCHFTCRARDFSQVEVGVALMERQNMFIIAQW